MSNIAVSVEDVDYEIGRKNILRGLSFVVMTGEVFALVGPSGCGKTTTLRIVSGLIRPSRGLVSVLGSDPYLVKPRDRRVVTVWQGQALFPHLPVEGNIGFGLRVRGVSRKEVEGRVSKIASRLGIEDRLGDPVQSLSGGERQRVALARALVVEPEVLLMDEPFTGLDSEIKLSLQADLRELLVERDCSYILVSHFHEDVFALADRVGVIQGGRVEQCGTPREIYEQPNTEFIAKFVGQRNVIPGVVSDVDNKGYVFVVTSFGGWWARNGVDVGKTESVFYVVDPGMVHLSRSNENSVEAEFRAVEGTGFREVLLLRLRRGKERMDIRVEQPAGSTARVVGGLIPVSWSRDDAFVLRR